MPLGIRWKQWSLPPVTTVWPALFPPCERMTMLTLSASRSMTLPLPSSPHWPPTRTVTLIAAGSVLDGAGTGGGLARARRGKLINARDWTGRNEKEHGRQEPVDRVDRPASTGLEVDRVIQRP